MLAVRLLGQLQVEVSGELTAVTAPLQRGVLASLALARGHALTMDQLVDALWDEPPANAVNAVQQYVSALRRRLGADRVVTAGGGYRLDVSKESVDVDRFQALTAEARRRQRAGDLAGAGRLLGEAIGLWRGMALADAPDCPFVVPARVVLEEALLEAEILQLAVENDLGHAAAVVARAEALAAQHPLDEAVAAQLMRALAGAGRTADALKVYERMRARLADELGADPGAELRAAQAGVLTQDPALVAAPAAPGLADSVPRSAGVLLGREAAVADVERLLHQPGVALVTLTGPGGVGKTRLAVELARRAAAGREVVYVAVDVIDSADLVMPTIAAALRLKPSPDGDPVTQIASVLRARDLLLVLDNLEHVIDTAADLARLLSLVEPGLQILVTSRESLRVSGEHVYRVAPLPTAGLAGGTAPRAGSEPVSSGEPPPPPAVELFWQRAEAASPGFRRQDDRQAVAGICARLDGLPLAIELAAARTNVLAPARILDRLSHRLTLLTAGTRDAPDRHRSLRACLEWSVDLLTGDERRLLETISVFAGGATIASLEAVGGDVLPGVDILAGIDSLVAKSLLRPVVDPSGPRFALLETVREFAAEQLAASGTEQATRLVHAHHFHDLLAPAADRVVPPPRNAMELATWSAELPNARLALRALADAEEAEFQADLVVALCPFWVIRGFWAEMESDSVALMERTDVPVRRRIELLRRAAKVALVRGDLDRAEDLVERGFALADRCPEPSPAQETYLHLAASAVALVRGDMDRDAEESRKAMAASVASGDSELIAVATASQPFLDGPEELAAMEWALTTAHEHGNQHVESGALVNLSELALTSDDPAVVARAEEWGRSGHEIAVLLGDLGDQANGLGNAAAAVLVAGGSAAQAAADLRSSLELARRVGDVIEQVEDLLRLAAAEAAQGHGESSAFLYGAWCQLARRYDQGMSPANQRIVDRFLHDLATQTDQEGLTAQFSLAEAVEVALGERPFPTSTEAPARGRSG